MSTSSPEVQWRQDAHGVWEYLASDGQWYAANPAAGTPTPPDGAGANGGGAPVAAPPVAPPVAPQPYAYAAQMFTCQRCGTPYEQTKLACPNCGTVGRAPEVQLTTAGRRLGQYLLDGLLALVTLYIGYIIWSLIIWKRGQTPGMQLLHIRVVKKDTLATASMGTMALRQIVGMWLVGGLLAYTVIGLVLYFMLLWDADRQQVWDKIAATVVINGDPQQQSAPMPSAA